MTHLRLDRTSLCLAPRQLLLFAASPMGDETYPLYARHTSCCDDCAAMVAAFRSSVPAVQSASGAHLAELELAELADRTEETVLHHRGTSHLAACSTCRASFAALCDILDNEKVNEALHQLESSAEPRPMRVAQAGRRRVAIGVFAAAAALLIVVESSLHNPSIVGNERVLPAKEALRHATIATAASPRILAPTGVVTRVDTLRWTEVPRADLYHVVVFDSTGAIAWQADVSDASALVPDSVSVRWAGRHSWFVKARTSVDRWVTSDFMEFDLHTH